MAGFRYRVEDQEQLVEFDYDPSEELLQLGDRRYRCDGRSVVLEGRRVPFWVHRTRSETLVWLDGEVYRFEPEDPHRRAEGGQHGGAAGGLVRAQMPGKVLRVAVRVGDRVEKGQNLLLMESMKMELALDAPVSGMVRAVEVKPDQMVAQGENLVEIEEE